MYYVYYYRNIDFAVAAAPAADDAIECVIDKVVPVSMTMCSVVETIALVLMTMASVVAVGLIAIVVVAALVAVSIVAAVDVELLALLVVQALAPAAVSVVPSLVVLP
jgi:hypothetical protein